MEIGMNHTAVKRTRYRIEILPPTALPGPCTHSGTLTTCELAGENMMHSRDPPRFSAALGASFSAATVVPEVSNAGTENAVTSTVSSPTRQLVNDDLESAARAATRELSQGTPPSPKRIAERLSRAENPELRI